MRRKRNLLASEIFQNIIDVLPVLLFWTDENDVYLGNNLQHANVFGFTRPKDLIGKTVAYSLKNAKVDDALIDRIQEEHAEVIESKQGKILEYTAALAGGEETTYLSYKQPLLDEKASVIGLVGVSVDITELKSAQLELISANKKAEEASRSAEKIFQNIVDALPVLLFWTSKDHILLGNNSPHAEAFGFSSPAELVGKGIDFPLKNAGFDNEFISRICSEHEEIMQSKKGKVLEYTARLADMKEYTHLSYKQPLLNEKNDVIGLTGISVDVTELKAAKEEAELANKAKSEFLANMSHDIRTPLTGMIGLTEEMISSDLSLQEMKSYSQELNAANHRLLQLLNEILELTKIEKGIFSGEESCFDLKSLSQGAVELMLPSIKEKGLKFSFNVDSMLPDKLIGQRILLHRVLLNLLSNAIKFTKKGHINVLIKVEARDFEAVAVLIQVQDTGIGIPNDKQDAIFDSFTRLSASYEGVYQGSGLGLNIVKQFVEGMNGRIEVESEVDQGSTFSCVIPFRLPTASEAARFFSQHKVDATLPAKSSLEALGSVLIVEDDPLAQKVAVAKLKKWHAEVDTASTGEEGLSKMKKNKYDLIYLDVGLPGIKGTEVAERFRAWEKETGQTKTPLLALTAHVDDKNKHFCLAAGMNKVLNKPLSNELAEEMCVRYVREKQLDHSEGVEKVVELAKPEEQVIDLELGARLIGSKSGAEELLASLVETLPETKADLQAAFEQNDWDQLKFVVHKLHGGTCYTPTPRLKLASFLLEQDLSGIREQVEGLYHDLLLEIDAVLKAYDRNAFV